MSSSTPFIRQIGWTSLFVHITVISIIILIWYLIVPENFILYGCATYLLLSFVLRRTMSSHHRAGISKVARQNFRAAIPDFEASYAYFTRNDWVDRYRYLTVLSSSKISFREMALVNIAFCYGQVGERDQSIEYYKRALIEFPDSQIARTALNLMVDPKKANLKP